MSISHPNFELPVENTENDYDEDCEPPPELLRLVEQEAREIKPHEEILETVNLGEDGEEKHVKIGASLTKEVQKRLCSLLREFKDVFAWSYQDMPGLDPAIVRHKLPLKPECSPIKQKLRRMKPEMALKIKEEVEK